MVKYIGFPVAARNVPTIIFLIDPPVKILHLAFGGKTPVGLLLMVIETTFIFSLSYILYASASI